ncbi:MAG: NAD(+) synthase [Clostridia bacterium]|nr:NAD(+) synthase [Clostridia bacterium]
MNRSFIRIAAASLKLKVADPMYNAKEIVNAAKTAADNKARLLVTPELSVTGYTCADLFFNNTLLTGAEDAVSYIIENTRELNITIIVGLPVAFSGKLYNCAAVLNKGKVIGLVPKTYIANYHEFYEKRWFAPANSGSVVIRSGVFDGVQMGRNLFDLGGGAVMGVELCEDLWAPVPPSTALTLAGANIICNLSASDEYVAKAEYRELLVSATSARLICAYAYAGASVFESTTDLVFSGAAIISEYGSITAKGERFVRDTVIVYSDIDIEKLESLRRQNITFGDSVQNNNDILTLDCCTENPECDLKYRYIDPHPFVPSDKDKMGKRCAEILSIQSSGLAKRIEHVRSNGCIIGISGGLDSTLALLVAVRAMKLLGKPIENIIGVTMPGFGTTDRTYTNALTLMKELGVTIREISIKEACLLHMSDIGHDPSIKDITYENTQARERTQVLFDLANKENCLLVGTGDLSELALGWCTYNGDHMSMYGVNASVPKTLVKYIVAYEAQCSSGSVRATLEDILDTPVSPELLPPDENGKIAQKTEDNIGPYELHDFFLYHFVRFGSSKEKILKIAAKAFDGVYSEETIKKWLNVFVRRFFISQFKRSCIPDSPKVGSVSLSPRGDWRMPSDASFEAFFEEF